MRTVLVAMILALLAAQAAAERITLTSPTGLSVTGFFVGFDGEFYRLDTEAGRVTLLGAGMVCEGAPCPEGGPEQVQIDAGDRATERLAMLLLYGFANAQGWTVVEHHDEAGPHTLSMAEADTPRLDVGLVASAGAWRILRDPRGAPPQGWRDIPLGFDALVPAVSVDNPVTGLTLLGVRAALAGEFPDWTGLGGGNYAVEVHWAPALDGPLVQRYQLGGGAGATLHADLADAADATARSPGGLALLPLSELGSAVPLVVTGPCGRGALGVPAAVRSGDYPLSEAIVLRVPAGRASPLQRAFIDWAETDASVASVLRRAGFVDLSVDVVPAGRDGRQEANPVSTTSSGAIAGGDGPGGALSGAQRLDVAMRFQDGSSLPDRASRTQIARLAKAIASGQFDGARLIFAGFSDANGPATGNLQLSRRRAEAIRAAVLAEAGEAAGSVTMEAEGFGEAMPVACNGTDWGESLNRRVEVWLAR